MCYISLASILAKIIFSTLHIRNMDLFYLQQYSYAIFLAQWSIFLQGSVVKYSYAIVQHYSYCYKYSQYLWLYGPYLSTISQYLCLTKNICLIFSTSISNLQLFSILYLHKSTCFMKNIFFFSSSTNRSWVLLAPSSIGIHFTTQSYAIKLAFSHSFYFHVIIGFYSINPVIQLCGLSFSLVFGYL